MDPSSSDLEFFDFKNSSDEEVKEIQAILKGPGSNGCVELPWEISLSNNPAEGLPETEGSAEANPAFTKTIENTAAHPLTYAPPPAPQLSHPSVETFVTLPTTVGHYQNAPYFVSRTLPYLRAYPPMGMPFFACPLPGTADSNPYGQFLPVAPEKFDPLENGSTPKTRQSSRRVKKRSDSAENGDISQEPVVSAVTQTSVPLGPSSVPLVPLPPSTFAVAGYPPGLHTLPYAQMAGQANSPAMYYLPVFNHPYGGYLPSPPIMLPEAAELNDCSSRVDDIGGRETTHSEQFQVTEEAPTYPPVEALTDFAPCEEMLVHPICEVVELKEDLAVPTAKPMEVQTIDSSHSSSEPFSEESSPSYLQDSDNCLGKVEAKELLTEALPSNDSQHIVSGSCPVESNVSKAECLQGTAPSNDCLSETVVQETSRAKVNKILKDKDLQETATDCLVEPVIQAKVGEKVKQVVRDPSRCWADLFKEPREVNGVDRHPPKRSTLKKDVANGKVYSVPANH